MAEGDIDKKDQRRVSGDPGVGGLLADPLEPSAPHAEPEPGSANPSPEPAPPRHHGDWRPTKSASERNSVRAQHD